MPADRRDGHALNRNLTLDKCTIEGETGPPMLRMCAHTSEAYRLRSAGHVGARFHNAGMSDAVRLRDFADKGARQRARGLPRLHSWHCDIAAHIAGCTAVCTAPSVLQN